MLPGSLFGNYFLFLLHEQRLFRHFPSHEPPKTSPCLVLTTCLKAQELKACLQKRCTSIQTDTVRSQSNFNTGYFEKLYQKDLLSVYPKWTSLLHLGHLVAAQVVLHKSVWKHHQEILTGLGAQLTTTEWQASQRLRRKRNREVSHQHP